MLMDAGKNEIDVKFYRLLCVLADLNLKRTNMAKIH